MKQGGDHKTKCTSWRKEVGSLVNDTSQRYQEHLESRTYLKRGCESKTCQPVPPWYVLFPLSVQRCHNGATRDQSSKMMTPSTSVPSELLRRISSVSSRSHCLPTAGTTRPTFPSALSTCQGTICPSHRETSGPGARAHRGAQSIWPGVRDASH